MDGFKLGDCNSREGIAEVEEMHGARRVITFCLLTAVLPTILLIIPLYLRHSVYADVIYEVSESDVLEAIDGISTVFCQEQILKMNISFRAFQLEQMPPLSNDKKHIQLQKSMTLPDDTLEYWGFYLLAGSVVGLAACSRHEGAGVILVKGEKHLETCGLMDIPYHKRHDMKNEVDKILSSLRKGLPLPRGEVGGETNLTDDVQAFKREVRELILNYSHNGSTRQYEGRKLRHEKKKFKDLKNLQVSNSSSLLSKSKGIDLNRNKLISNQTKYDESKRALMQTLRSSEINSGEDRGEEMEDDDIDHPKGKRNAVFTTGHILDAGVGHGGNANVTEDPDVESSQSSFEDSLKKCYGQQLITERIEPSSFCFSPNSLNVSHKINPVSVSSDGYYYFIFYSDNDRFQNPIHAHFDIYKSTYQNTNYTRGCINKTECKFPISFWSNEIVIVEVPTRDGIEHEDDDTSFLISSCYPRMSVYVIFPIAVLFLILGCAFL